MYLFRKWYFDLLTPDGTYLFLYFAFVRLAGSTMRSLVLHISPGGSDRTLTRSLPVESHREEDRDGHEIVIGLRSGRISASGTSCQIAAGDSGTSVDLMYTRIAPGGKSPVLIDAARRGHILWEPMGIRYDVEGSVTIEGSRHTLRGCTGYADFLECTILPPWVPVRHLFWGRAHCPDSDLAYMHASGAGGNPSWSRLLLHRDGTVVESDRVEVISRSEPLTGSSAMGQGGYSLRARLDGEEYVMKVTHQKTVQNASFIDQQRIRWSIARTLAKSITRDPRGSKFLSCADIPPWGMDGRTSIMIDEEAYL